MGSCLIILARKNILLYTLLGNIKNISWKFELNPLIILRGVLFCLSYQFYNQVTRLSILTIHRCYGLRNFALWALFSLHFYSTYRVFLVRCFFEMAGIQSLLKILTKFQMSDHYYIWKFHVVLRFLKSVKK